ncbi:anthranilate synthase component I [candidate division KSB1 bacterium]|nr:anthranilate synthase component I [candidate division KSB1 bacterium]
MLKITSFEQFELNYKAGYLQPISAEILGDLDTPVSIFLKATKGPYRFLLESVEGGAQRGRYSIIGDSPLAVFKNKNNVSQLHNFVTGDVNQFTGDPFHFLKKILQKYVNTPASDTPFINSGLFGYLSYDSIRHIERLPELAVDDINLPDIHLFIPQKMIVFDNLYNKIIIINFVIPAGDKEIEYRKAVQNTRQIIKNIQTQNLPRNGHQEAPKSGHIQSNLKKSEFEKIVSKTKEYISKGDIFQGVLSQRLKVTTQVPPFDIYRALRVINPSPYMFYLELDGLFVLGSSPETLVKLNNGKVEVKPIAGTRKRGADDKEDELLIKELLADPKERAEHTMLVDLGRNDIGRIAEYGTVHVDDLMITEKYSHVIHIVSSVSGTLRNGMDSIDVFKACFPAGTVSGAPKVRAMEIIEELEPTRRSIYAGAAGYFSFDGNMDVCIAIRTIYVKEGTAYLQAGAGIVAESVPEKEYEETLNKARGLLKAIEYAEGGLV